jgi:hypothetical protein
MAPVFRHGKGTVIQMATAGSTSGAIKLSSGFSDSSLQRAVDKAEASVYGDSVKRYLVGLQDATFTLGGNFSSTHEKLLTRMLGNSTGCYFIYSPESTAAGRRKFKFAGVITNLTINSPAGDKVGIDVEVSVNGNITSTNW